MRIACLVGLAVAVSVGGVCRADTLRWVNAAGGNFADGGNWDLGRVPGAWDLVVFDLPGTYTVTLPGGEPGTTITGMDVVRGTVTLAGPGTLQISFNDGANHRVRIGLGSEAATVIISNLSIYEAVGPVDVAAQGTMITRSSGSLYTFNSTMRVLAGGLVRMESGSISPKVLRFEGGRGEAAGGRIDGETVVMLDGSEVLVSGAGASFTCESGMTLAGSVRLESGGTLSLAPGGNGSAVFTSQGCSLVVGNGGSAMLTEITTDDATSVEIDNGGSWNGGGNSQYRGSFKGLPGSTVRLSGQYFVAPELDEAAVNQEDSFVVMMAGLIATIDPLIQPATAVVRRGAGLHPETHAGGELSIQVRNPNALRVGDIIPILEHNMYGTEQFSTLTAPVLGGGRALEMFVEGSPVTTYVRVIAAEPSCYTADFNGDGDIGTDTDIQAFFACLAGDCCATCASTDFNGDGDLGTDLDIEAFFRVLGGGAC